MGGEPTFVSIDDMDGAEWNTEALGPTKRARRASCSASCATASRGRAAFRPGQVVSRRAAAALGAQLLLAQGRRADLARPRSLCRGATRRPAPRRRRRIALRSPSRSACSSIPAISSPAFEDTWYYLWRERRLPSNVDDRPASSRRIRWSASAWRTCSRRASESAGRHRAAHPARAQRPRPLAQRTVVPAQREMLPDPGDSPLGYRLPLDSLPWAAPADLGFIRRARSHGLRIPTCRRWKRSVARRCCGTKNAARSVVGPPTPTATARCAAKPGGARWRPISGCARRRPLGRQHRAHRDLASSRATAISTSSCRRPSAPRTISTSSPRSRTPPRSSASRCSSKAIRRRDPRLQSFSVTPDPGVIEVNIHPATNWRELVTKTRSSTRRRARRGWARRKFMLDGRHTGTGGGNHFVSAAHGRRQPLLRRPDLLRA
jgi:uncharacterized protein (DUF2126 family)